MVTIIVVKFVKYTMEHYPAATRPRPLNVIID